MTTLTRGLLFQELSLSPETASSDSTSPKATDNPHGDYSFDRTGVSILERLNRELKGQGPVEKVCPRCHSLLIPGKSCLVSLSPLKSKDVHIREQSLSSEQARAKQRDAVVEYTCNHCGCGSTFNVAPSQCRTREDGHKGSRSRSVAESRTEELIERYNAEYSARLESMTAERESIRGSISEFSRPRSSFSYAEEALIKAEAIAGVRQEAHAAHLARLEAEHYAAHARSQMAAAQAQIRKASADSIREISSMRRELEAKDKAAEKSQANMALSKYVARQEAIRKARERDEAKAAADAAEDRVSTLCSKMAMRCVMEFLTQGRRLDLALRLEIWVGKCGLAAKRASSDRQRQSVKVAIESTVIANEKMLAVKDPKSNPNPN